MVLVNDQWVVSSKVWIKRAGAKISRVSPLRPSGIKRHVPGEEPQRGISNGIPRTSLSSGLLVTPYSKDDRGSVAEVWSLAKPHQCIYRLDFTERVSSMVVRQIGDCPDIHSLQEVFSDAVVINANQSEPPEYSKHVRKRTNKINKKCRLLLPP